MCHPTHLHLRGQALLCCGGWKTPGCHILCAPLPAATQRRRARPRQQAFGPWAPAALRSRACCAWPAGGTMHSPGEGSLSLRTSQRREWQRQGRAVSRRGWRQQGRAGQYRKRQQGRAGQHRKRQQGRAGQHRKRQLRAARVIQTSRRRATSPLWPKCRRSACRCSWIL